MKRRFYTHTALVMAYLLFGFISCSLNFWRVRISHILCESFRREVPVRVFRNALANSPTFIPLLKKMQKTIRSESSTA
ncbi:hypothetical protein D9G48_25510 [Escherichia coli]|nr:hypothetical protein [Escherichia coli]EFN7213417.1 hypothetical protein [Escherichia coli O2]MGT37534.1 hypothetical protein [Escherichia coli]MHN97429.1 hypothetical protein [Escherichia coli]MHO93934.1 hypothetical protein [Escherichia coli]